MLRRVSERRSPASLALAILVHAAIGGIVIGGAMLATSPNSPPEPEKPVWLTAPRIAPPARPRGPRPGQPPRGGDPVRPPTPAPPMPPPEVVPTTIPVDSTPSAEPISGESSLPGIGDGHGPGGDDPFGSPGGDPNGSTGATGDDFGPPPSEPMRLKSDMTPPKILHRVEPELPLMAVRMGLRNVEVVVECVIREDGTVAVERVMKSNPMLDEAVIAAVNQWTYEPATWNGRPQAVFQIVRVKVN